METSASRGHTLDDLRRVIRRIERARPPRPAEPPVEEVLGGDVVETDAGPILQLRREYPLSHRHGHLTLEAAAGPSTELRALATPVWEPAFDPRTLLFLDVETTGLAGGTGTYAFLVGAGHVEGDRFVVTQHFMRDLDEEPGLLAALTPLLDRARGIVSFNGTGFDLPLLETRFILARRRWPGALPHLDLLRPVRRVWAPALTDCRLTTLEREVLGLVRDADVPGALVPTLYFEFLRSRRAAPLARVLDHNRADVLSLVTLLGWFSQALERRDGVPLSPRALAGLGRLWEPTDPDQAAACYHDALGAGLDGALGHWVRLRLARWEKRQARWETACALWEEASRGEGFDPRPWEELAKFHEHRRRDVAAARAVVESALALAQAASAAQQVIEAFGYRLARLRRRLGSRRSPRTGRTT